MPDYIYRDDRPIAQPSFRILVYCLQPLANPAISNTMAELLDVFVSTYREELAYIVISDDERPMLGRHVDDDAIADARDWLANATKPWPSTCRLFSHINEEAQAITVPSYRAEQAADYCFLDMSVPADPQRVKDFADDVTDIIKDCPILYSVMGMGFFLPASLESLETFLPRAYPRYKTAIEFMAEGARWGLHKEIGNFDWQGYPNATPGIPTIGWRTILATHYLNDLPNLETVTQTPGVSLERTDNMAIVTAGDLPIWGDVNASEDISAYQAVAAALKPVRVHIEPALSGLFGSLRSDPQGRDRLEAYLSRFD